MKGLKFNEVDGSKQRQGIPGVYQGLEYEMDLLQKTGAWKKKQTRNGKRSHDRESRTRKEEQWR